jgi:hypothetical protein
MDGTPVQTIESGKQKVIVTEIAGQYRNFRMYNAVGIESLPLAIRCLTKYGGTSASNRHRETRTQES